MYGTIARIHPKPEHVDEVLASADTWLDDRQVPSGFRHSFIVKPDQDPYDRPTLFLVAVFDDRASYVANAESPEQDAEYRRLRALLEDDPDWMDGTFLGG